MNRLHKVRFNKKHKEPFIASNVNALHMRGGFVWKKK